MCLTRQAEMPPCGYKRRSRSRARHGRSTSSTGSQSANVGSREGDFGFSPDSGRGPGVALTGSFDPIETLRSRIISWHQAHVSQVCVMIQGFSTRTSEWVAAKRKELQEQANRSQQEFVSRQKVEELFGRGIGQVRKALAEVMKEIADERGISLILLKATIVLASPELDITEEALRRLDKRLPSTNLAASDN